MTCLYCGNAALGNDRFCAGCGAPRTAPITSPWDTQASVYEQIGRAVVNREPNEALDRLLRVGERDTASQKERTVARVAKLAFCGFVLWQFPMILLPLLSMGFMFFFWFYLPYQGFKRFVKWISS